MRISDWSSDVCSSDLEDDQHMVRLVRDFHGSAADGQLDPRTAQVDLAVVEQMGRHHQGAVDMVETYLDDPRGRNQASANSRGSKRLSPCRSKKIAASRAMQERQSTTVPKTSKQKAFIGVMRAASFTDSCINRPDCG